jgi:predicted permease
VANLFIARAAAREREMALRVSIGAGRSRLVQQVLVESVLLASGACILGLGLAAAAAPAMVSLLSPASNPAYLDLRIDWRVLGYVALLCALTTVLFGLAPALRASTVSPSSALKAGGQKHSEGMGVFRPLVSAQVGFSFVVLFLSGLLLLTFQKLTSVDLGFSKTGILLFSIEAKDLEAGQPTRVATRQLRDHIRELSGVEAASLSSWSLFGGQRWSASIRLPGQETESFSPFYLGVSPGFFETMGIRLLDGRELEPRDTEPEQPTAVIVNEAFARQFFSGENPLGRSFSRLGHPGELTQEIVGVVADAKYDRIREPAPPTVYVPYAGGSQGTLEVRTTLDPLAMVATLREEIQRVHPAFQVTDVSLQSTLVENDMLRERLLALLSGFFAVVALVLAAVGLYGVLNYSVVRRTKEIGIRVALGARQFAVVRLVISEISLLVILGLAGGAAAGFWLAQFVAALLFEVQPSDFWSLALPLACLLAAAALAAAPPAMRAARVDPMVALRYE